eukprot:3223439-Rhodomonas_salina.5
MRTRHDSSLLPVVATDSDTSPDCGSQSFYIALEMKGEIERTSVKDPRPGLRLDDVRRGVIALHCRTGYEAQKMR